MEYWTGLLDKKFKEQKDIGNFSTGKEHALKGPTMELLKIRIGQTQSPHVKFLGSLGF
jgi:hypothetical protein